MLDVDAKDRFQVINLFKEGVFWIIHIGALLVIWTGISWVAAVVCILLYLIRMFAITGGYHRYFSHRTFETNRFFQFILAFLGAMAAQKGPIWWSSHHRHHHKHSDTEEDVHPPALYGIWWAHVGWVLSSRYVGTRKELVRDLLAIPELRWLDNYHWIAPLSLATLCYGFGTFLAAYYPNLNTNGFQMLIVGFCLSTTLLYHGTFCINSFCHIIGKKRFNTSDQSKNSLLMALITLGEGWHNNHHRYPGSEKQGFYWWEIDITHYTLKFLSLFGIVWNLRVPPERIYEEARRRPA
ncbi:MAG TPA: acyl-CoA desaturase [Oligoflexia bacterium]|nr:acyl-CoA desaturase [Oligoflexia bacterium]HMP26976.1 acyl-CoA desaturase [Oligoflexia bacterium]